MSTTADKAGVSVCTAAAVEDGNGDLGITWPERSFAEVALTLVLASVGGAVIDVSSSPPAFRARGILVQEDGSEP